MTIEEMQLAPVAKEAAAILRTKHPNIEFTSGRRDIRQQAHAMAGNIVALHERKLDRQDLSGGWKMSGVGRPASGSGNRWCVN